MPHPISVSNLLSCMRVPYYLVLLLGWCNGLSAQSLDALSLQALDSLSLVYEETADETRAMDCLLEGIQRLEKSPSLTQDTTYLHFLLRAAALYFELEENEEGQAMTERAARAFQAHPLPGSRFEAGLLEFRGLAAQRSDQFDQAERLFQQSIQLYKSLPQPILLAGVYDKLGHLYLQTGREADAEPIYREALRLVMQHKGKANSHYTTILNDLAILYRRSQRFTEAERAYREIMSIEEKLYGKDHPEYLITVNNLAVTYHFQGKSAESEEIFKDLLRATEKQSGRVSEDYVIALNNLAVLYHSSRRLEDARKAYLDLLELSAAVYGKQHSEYAFYLGNIGQLYIDTKEFDQAEAHLRQALEITQQVFSSKHPEYTRLLIAFALLFEQKGDYRRALDYSIQSFISNQRSQTLASQPGLSSEFIQTISQKDAISKTQFIVAISRLIDIIGGLSQTEQDPQWREFHRQICWMALEEMEAMENAFELEENKMRVLSNNSKIIESGIHLSMRLYQDQPEQEYLEQAFLFAEHDKATVLAQAVKSNYARSFGLPDSLGQQERALHQELAQAQRQLLYAATPEENAAANAQFNQLTRQISDFEKRLEQRYPQYHQLKYARPHVGLDDLRRLLPAGALLVEYYMSDTACYAFGLSAEGLRAITIAQSRDSLELMTERLRQALSNYDFILNAPELAQRLYVDNAYPLYQLLLQPLLQHFPQTTHLLLIPDEFLGSIPFETLLTEAPTHAQYRQYPYLLREYGIRYVASGVLLAENQNIPRARTNGQLLAFAAAYPPADSAWLALRSPADFYTRSLLQDLPAAEKEVQTLEREFAGDFCYQQQANEAQFRALASDHSVLHLAMHGLLDKKNPILSRLAFSENGDTAQDNFLYAYEIAHLSLRSDLVVLSACETGYGKLQAGEGMLSLARAFFYAGVPSLVVSLWEVNDASTAALMLHFYRALSDGKRKSDALRHAKLSYLEQAQGIAAHPAFWAPFVLMGSDDPVHLKQKNANGWLVWLWPAGAVLLLLLTRYFYRR